ncbi:WecB/TagA/CpsF family glycosyltransferase [Shewanella psychromarinicola]|uniref:WecB/TagA/CpsF family glycosyltransferase n=1 Tax=Shewanella psychromarinicola TaxID=2487742 RepID=A0A3N4E845_9GAMM|nr:WecB/TagA/CpsF family glycosyltransferase [Shewanella psychromarinicola]AZG35697.1 WecB/TagA/CpsF family glycosyltransferase [Shewanella psychromarinicola]MCL1081503.1 WecB/TagA/CpsF family glycosyltransferase [Shewanella psychromarinicola]RPA30380.1 WecB/TagA/CpsF family glycosyltransferase [Shewanella psychromarinicola]
MRTHIKNISWSVRIVESIISLILLLLVSPLLLLKACYLKYQHAQAIEVVYLHSGNEKPIALLQFIQPQWSYWLGLINVIKGELGFVGCQYQYEVLEYQDYIVRPGLMSFSQMHSRMGIAYDKFTIDPKLNASVSRYILTTLRYLIGYTLSSKMVCTSQTHFTLLKVAISNVTMKQAIDSLLTSGRSRNCDAFAFVNTDCMNIAHTNIEYRQVLNQTKQVFADGSGLRLACKYNHIVLKDNVNGTDMFPRLCEQAAKNGTSIYFLGAKPGVAEKAAANMTKRYPQLRIAGIQDGYFKAHQTEDIIKHINQSDSGILLVAMGAPTQEMWIANHQHQLNVGAAVGVGGLFDFYADAVTRAPLALRQMGMEWTWRLMQEPKRMWRRYIIGNPLFVLRVLIDLIAQRLLAHKSANKATLQFASTPSQNANPLVATSINVNLLDATTQRKSWGKQRWFFSKIKLNQISKRLLDISASASLLLMLSPLLLLTACAIRLESKGNVFFSQTRAGQDNQPFTMFKFRSMFTDAEARLGKLTAQNDMQGGVLFKMKSDPRITHIGAWIRKLSIDELPQLWNVFKGDMSLVGPRPALPSEVNQYQLSDRRRLMVKPGITCIWQVSGRSHIPFDKQVELDVDYIYQQSLIKDIKLLFKTIPAVIFARGAY